jgi:2-hydroxymuconate-semialdehyde hydrolase
MTETSPEVGTFVDAAGIRTNVHDVGRGEPVLLLHGSGPGVTAWANWRLTIPALAERFRVVAPDVVGFGFTERPADFAFDLDSWTAHVVGLLDALDIESAHVVGNSFGGGLALSLAVRHPDRVRRLVLMGSVGTAMPLTPGLDAVWGYQPSLENMRALLDLFAFDRSLVTDDIARMRYEASMRPGVQEAFAALFPEPRQAALDALSQTEADLRALPHRTLVVHGREDRVIDPAASVRLFELIPRAELHMFGRCGHWTQIEHADRFASLVADFLASP